MSAHIAEYNGKRVAVDYVHPQRQFRVACLRIICSGASGVVHCPDGKRYEVRQASRLAVLVRNLNALPGAEVMI
jgi:hypothetical protein